MKYFFKIFFKKIVNIERKNKKIVHIINLREILFGRLAHLIRNWLNFQSK